MKEFFYLNSQFLLSHWEYSGLSCLGWLDHGLSYHPIASTIFNFQILALNL